MSLSGEIPKNGISNCTRDFKKMPAEIVKLSARRHRESAKKISKIVNRRAENSRDKARTAQREPDHRGVAPTALMEEREAISMCGEICTRFYFLRAASSVSQSASDISAK